MLRPDLRSGLSDRRGNVISLDLFNFGFCNRSSNIRKRKRGIPGGKLAMFRQRCYNAPQPKIILTNEQSIHNKINEIVSRINNFCDYRDCNELMFASFHKEAFPI